MSTETIMPMPLEIINDHGDITIGMDIMFVNGTTFLTTVSRAIKLGTATEMSGATMDNVITALKIIK